MLQATHFVASNHRALLKLSPKMLSLTINSYSPSPNLSQSLYTCTLQLQTCEVIYIGLKKENCSFEPQLF